MLRLFTAKTVKATNIRLGYSLRLFLLNPQQKLSPPKNTLRIFASRRFAKGITLSAEYYYNSNWRWNDAPNTNLSKIDRFDFRIAKDFKYRDIDVEISLQGELELGENRNYLSRNEVDDWYFAGLKFNLP